MNGADGPLVMGRAEAARQAGYGTVRPPGKPRAAKGQPRGRKPQVLETPTSAFGKLRSPDSAGQCPNSRVKRTYGGHAIKVEIDRERTYDGTNRRSSTRFADHCSETTRLVEWGEGG